MKKYNIPFSGRAHSFTDPEIKTVLDVMQSADPLTQGKHRNQFETSFIDFQGGTGKHMPWDVLLMR